MLTIVRTATKEVKLLARQFKAIGIVGPRQSGKTTLARTVPDKKYAFLENLDYKLFAKEDTRGFLAQYAEGNLKFWQKITGTEGGTVSYGGEQSQNRSNGLKIVPWDSPEARI